MEENNNLSNEERMTWSMIKRFASGESDAMEQEIVLKWMSKETQRRRLIEQIGVIWNTPAEHKINWDVDASWQRYLDRYGMHELNPVVRMSPRVESYSKYEHRQITPSRFGFIAAAATILLLCTVLAVMYFSVSEIEEQQLVTMQEITIPKGQRSTIQLSDGSRVALNADSRLSIPSDFGVSNRTLYLEGEAYFEVQHDPNKPFRVYTNGIYTEVLGTAFNINAYETDLGGTVKVFVTEGLVEVGDEKINGSRLALLNPNQLGRVGRDGMVRISDVEDHNAIIGWIEGKLTFENEVLSEVFKRMERRYNIDIEVDDEMILNRRVSATFGSEPLTEVLNVLAVSLQLSYQREGNHIVFSRN